jgi:predicted small integral membrane protein
MSPAFARASVQFWLLFKVDSHVKRVVIPIRFMVAAPLASLVQPRTILIDLMAVWTAAGRVVVDPDLCVLQFLMAGRSRVWISSCGNAYWHR